MRKRSPSVILAAVFLLCAVGGAGAQTGQTLLPGALIPKFVDPLPVAGQISVVNATDGRQPRPQLSTPSYNITMSEFQAQILPSTVFRCGSSHCGLSHLPGSGAI